MASDLTTTTAPANRKPSNGSGPPSMDYDGMGDSQIIDLFKRVKEAWQPRDEDIRKAVELRRQDWTVPVPKAWQTTAKQHHTSRAKEIPERVKGTLMLNWPTYSRPNPGEDFGMGEDQNQVERFFNGYLRYWDRKSLKSRSGREFVLDNFVGKGGVCVGNLLAAYHWAGAPILFDGDQVRRQFWRDSSGKETGDYAKVDIDAATRAHARSIDQHRQTVSLNDAKGMPLRKRLLPPDQCYPVIVEGDMLALFIERRASLVELNAAGWALDLETKGYWDKTFIECITPNRVRCYAGEDPVSYKGSKDGLTTGYGFVSYVYQTAMSAGDTEYGCWGMPLLGLVDSNIRTIDTLRTYLMNAVHLASFTSFVIEYVGDVKSVASLVDNKTGKKLTTFEFKSGTIMDFGPGRKVVPLTHPGLNADFWKALAAEEADVDRIIPRTLTGEAASSGYNTAQSTVQARALFNSQFHAEELLYEQCAEQDMRNIERLNGPVWLDWEKPSSGRQKQFERVKIDKSLIGGYYQIQVDTDRTIDYITEGTWAVNQVAGGVGDIEWASQKSGIPDYENMLARRARDRVFTSESTMAALDAAAVDRFKLKQALNRAKVQAQISQSEDGFPVLNLGDGRVAGPGAGIRTPQAAGAFGVQGGANGNTALQANGGPNLASTNNPSIEQPSPTPTGRSRQRRRGGANPGAPQRAAVRPEPRNPAAQ
jgi:hypothetical protein